jgi:hypothetical protein
MSSINLIVIETGLLLSGMAFFSWLGQRGHRAAMQVYSGVADGVRLSRRTRRLILIYVYGGNMSGAFVASALVGLALVQIGMTAPSPEAANMAYLFALPLFLNVLYSVATIGMTVFSLGKMVDRGLRGELAS